MHPNSTKHTNTIVYGPMGRIRCVCCKKFQCDLMAQTCALIAPVQPILHRVPCSNETLPNAPRHNEMLQNMSLGSMVWIQSVLCEKFRCDFMAQTCALIATVQPVLPWVSCTNETLTNATKHYETHQYMSLGFNGVDRVCSLLKISTRLRGPNFCTSSTILHRVS